MVLQGAATVFADADESFATVGALKERLEGWRARYPAAFRDAYMTVSSPAVFSPFVRLELLSWDPVFGASTAGALAGPVLPADHVQIVAGPTASAR